MFKPSVLAIALVALSLAACGGGGGSPGGGGILPGAGGSPTPTSSPTAPPSSSQTSSLGSAPTTFTLPAISSGASGTVTFPAVTGSASATVTLSSTLPGGAPAPSVRSVHNMRKIDALGGTVTSIAYLTVTLTGKVSISQTPAFAMTFPAGTLSGYQYVALYDPTQPSNGWNAFLGPQGPAASGATSVSFSAVAISPPVTLAANVSYVFAIVESGTPLPTPTPIATATSSPTATPAPGTTPAVVAGPGTPLGGAPTYNNSWTPFGVANGLDFPVQHGWDGTGEKVAIVIDSDVDRSVIASYLAKMRVTETGTITTVPVDGAKGIPSQGASAGDQTEAYLDVETVAGLAPGANIYIYDIPNLNDASIADAYSKIDSDGIVSIANSSFGGCENASSPEDPFIASGTKAGILYVASSGDSGNVCDAATTVGASWPASNPNVIAAGGTETDYTQGYNVTEPTVWNDYSCGGQCAGGGGVSSIYSLPSYQTGLQGATSTTMRNEPDISMPAEDDAIYDGKWGAVNGTSWASPEFAALMAEVYQYCHLSGPVTNPINIPYYVASTYPQAYIDVTNGKDQFKMYTPFYTAGRGYDNASGFGLPIGMAFGNTVCPGGVKSSKLPSYARVAQAVQTRRASAFAADVTPRMGGLADQGRRSVSAMTAVQVVLRSEGDRASVESALERAGFTIDRRYQYDRIIHAQAPSGTVEGFFSTRMHDVLQPRYGMRYLPATQIVVPASIASGVRTVNLDNVITRHVLTRTSAGGIL